MYVYGTDGTYYADEDFGSVDDDPRGITFNDNTFFVLGNEQDKVFAFSLDLTRVEKDFSASWSILEPVQKDFSGKWGILEKVQKDFSGVWSITHSRVTRDTDSDFALTAINGNARGITWSEDDQMFWVADRDDNKLYAYNQNGTRAVASDITLNSLNGLALGVCYINDGGTGYLYVLDRTQRKFFVYDTSGERQTDREFSTLGANQDGCANYDNKLYVIDRVSRQIYVYQLDGTRVTDDEFLLSTLHDAVRGLTIAFGHLYVVDSTDDKVYAYNLDGSIYEDGEFILDSENTLALGMTFGNGNKFWVVDRTELHVFAYQLAVTRVEKDFSGVWSTVQRITKDFSGLWDIFTNDQFSGSFDLDSANRSPGGITVATIDDVTRLYVIDWINDYIYAYNLNGARYSAGDIDVSEGDTPRGIAFHDDKFYILSAAERKIFVYNPDGTRVSDEDFDTLGTNQEGMAIYNEKIYIIQRNTTREHVVYVYQIDGTRLLDEEFTITTSDMVAYRGMIIVDDVIYLEESFTHDNIIAFNLDGDPLTNRGFNLDDENVGSRGLTYDNNTFFTVDTTIHKVFEYTPFTRILKDFLGKWAINSRDSEVPIPYLAGAFNLDQTCTGIAGIGEDLLILKNTVIERHTTEGTSVSPNYNYNSLNTGRNGAAYLGGILYVVDRGLSRIYKYDLEAGTHTELNISGIQASGIIVHSSKIHLTNTNGSVRTLNALGQTEQNTTLHADNTRPQGITRHSGKYYIPDSNGLVYAYNDDFSPYTAGNFSLRIGDDDSVGGITVVGGVFFVLINDTVVPFGPVVFGVSKTGKWSITESVEKAFSGSWSILERVQKDFVSKWSIIERVEKAFSGLWDITIRVTKDFSGLWDILEQDLEVTYDANSNIPVSGVSNIQGLGSKEGKVFVLSYDARYVFAFNLDGTRSSADDFSLQTGNSAPFGMSYYNEKWYVLNDSGEGARIYRYNADGGADGNLGIVGVSPISARAITVFGDKIYLTDNESGNKRIHKLDLDGVLEESFDLDYISNVRPLGLANYQDKLFIADNIDKVYGLFPDGTRNTSGDFDLEGGNQSPSGMTETNDTFYVYDRADNIIYAYLIGTSIIEKAFSGVWSIVQRVEATHSGKWSILERVEKSFSGSWNIIQRIEKEFSGVWSIGSILVKDFLGKWNITERVEKDFDGSWSILARIEKEFSGAWSIIERVEKEFYGVWSIGGILVKDFIGKWSITERVEKEFLGKWSILARIEKSFSGAWSIIERVEKSFSGVWSIGSILVKDFVGKWSVLERVQKAFSGVWSIDGSEPVVDLTNVPYFTLPYSLKTETLKFYKISPGEYI